MEAANPFAQMPSTPEAIIAQVCRALAADCGAAVCPPRSEVDRVAEIAVRELWEGKVRVFVPILALRQARETLHLRDWTITTPERATIAETTSRPRSVRDALTIDSDVLLVDERDVLNLRDDHHA